MRTTLRAERTAQDDLFRGKLPPQPANQASGGWVTGIVAAAKDMMRWFVGVASNMCNFVLRRQTLHT